MPQSLPCLAAVLRKESFDVRVFDCAPIKMGWKSLSNLLREEKPDIIGVGDSESLYAHEAIRVLNITKEINPHTITVAGGAHFPNLVEDSLLNQPIDFIVKGEGEYTLLELAKAIRDGEQNFRNIEGIAFKEDNMIVETDPRPLIENLDELPFPAYDLMPMHEYGKARFLFSPGGITIHHSRGCIHTCKFCVWWTQMADRKIIDGKNILRPRWRTKSVERTIDEIKILYYKYNKRYLLFVDDSWNIDSSWNEHFAEAFLKEDIKIRWYAFMRADLLLRDEKKGILKKLAKSGLSHISIGVERVEDDELKNMGKTCYSRDMIKECMLMLKNKYPQIFRQATFIVGTRNESRESFFQQVKYAREIEPDYPAFHPLTPLPGTQLWEEVQRENLLEVKDFRYHDWYSPVMSSRYLSREEIQYLIYVANKQFASPFWIIKGLFSPFEYKRNLYIWWFLVMLKIFFDLAKKFVNPFGSSEYTVLIKPKWYDS